MITRTLNLLALAALPLLAQAGERPAPPTQPVAQRDNGCEAVLRDTRHPRFAACLAAAYRAQLAKP